MAKTPGQLAAARRYREKNRELLREKGRAYDQARRSDPAVLEAEATAARERRARNPERAREIRETFLARHPGYEAERMREWRAKNPAKNQENTRRAQEANPDRAHHLSKIRAATRRARLAGAPHVERIDRTEIFARDAGRCHICRKACKPNRFDLDHLVPLSRGGSHVWENLSVSHPTCNRKRGAGRIPAQLLLRVGA